MQPIRLRDFDAADGAAVDVVALAAFEQFHDSYDDWSAFRAGVARMSSLAASGELIVATDVEAIVGAVAYIGPNRPKAAFFQPEWPVMRMLVVSPAMRGRGVGRLLAEECLRRARRDGASVFALHTSPIMAVALPMYLRMGFRLHRSVPPIHGVRYDVYLKVLDEPR